MKGVRSLALADVDEQTLERLATAEGEHLFVELKETIPEHVKFAAEIASFANTLGGWLLLGVRDEPREIVGFSPAKRLDLQSHFGNILRNHLDPPPPFAARSYQLRGKTLGVVRVFESTDTPHIVRETGAIYVRDAGGKQPVPDYKAVIDLSRRGETALREAQQRLSKLDLVREYLQSRRTIGSIPPGPSLELALRAAPLTVPRPFPDWLLSAAGAGWCERVAKTMADTFGRSDARSHVRVTPRARGIVATCPFSPDGHGINVLADAGGVIGIRATLRRKLDPSLNLGWFEQSALCPVIREIAEGLSLAEAHGRAAVEMSLVLLKMTIETAPKEVQTFDASRELPIPADDEEQAGLARQLVVELSREAGFKPWEDE